ncbi:hypothetical protein ACWC4J_40865, partial [Streptomyces sp. NPDC001356]
PEPVAAPALPFGRTRPTGSVERGRPANPCTFKHVGDSADSVIRTCVDACPIRRRAGTGAGCRRPRAGTLATCARRAALRAELIPAALRAELIPDERQLNTNHHEHVFPPDGGRDAASPAR